MNVWAPGRVNLIGDHTDYSGGLALPMAIQLGLSFDVERDNSWIVVRSDAFGATDAIAPDGGGEGVRGWGRFVQAVACELHELGRPPVGMRATIASTVPAGAGLSSSAALEVGVAVALCAVAGFELEPLELASACRRAEHRAVGVRCGILDHAACVLGQRGAAVLLDCRSLEHRLVEVPPEAVFLIIDSGVSRALEDTAYSERRREAERAIAQLGAVHPRDVSTESLELDDPLLRRRLRHIVTENKRVLKFAAALETGDLATAGLLLSASHASLRDDYEVSLPELDALVAVAEENGSLGARLIGGGFGGSILALVEASRAGDVAGRIARANGHRRPPIAVRASVGARACWLAVDRDTVNCESTTEWRVPIGYGAQAVVGTKLVSSVQEVDVSHGLDPPSLAM